jgi:hypothetical protein
MSKKNKQIYLKAAKLIEVGKQTYCCHALRWAGALPSMQYQFWQGTFRPQKDRRSQTWFQVLLRQGQTGTVELASQARQERVIALCFAAAMAETGDL